MTFILMFAVLTIGFASFITFQLAATRREGVALNVTLPKKALSHPQTIALLNEYKRANIVTHLLLTAVGSATALIPGLDISFFLSWAIAAAVVGYLPFRIYSARLVRLKNENDWHQASDDLVRVDLAVSKAKKGMAVSKLLFLPPLVISGGLLAAAACLKADFFPPVFALANTILFFGLYLLAAKEPARAYSKDTKVNLAVTRTVIRAWTLCWAALANLTAVTMLIAALFPGWPKPTLFANLPIALIIQTCLLLGAVFFTAISTQKKQGKILGSIDADYTADEDHYWGGTFPGLFYNNPRDSRILVKRRIGVGYTFNLGTLAGKLIAYSTLILVGAMLLYTVVVLAAMGTIQFDMEFSPREISIKAPLYGYSFEAGTIKSLTTIDELPAGVRTNGAATNKYLLGNFDLESYGKSKMYVYRNNPPYIVIELPGLYLFFNRKNAGETRSYYNQLREHRL